MGDVIREIVYEDDEERESKKRKEYGRYVVVLTKIVCRHCGYEYDTRYSRCPRCGK